MDTSVLVITAVAAVVAIVILVKVFGGSKTAASGMPKPVLTNPASGGSSNTTRKAPKPAEPEVEGLIPMDVYFGSQTGTAERYAKQLILQGKKHGFKGRFLDLATFKKEDLTAGGIALFVVATYGEGDPTDNALAFYKWITAATTAADTLTTLKYAVFGLGSTQYENYNKMGKDVDSRLAAIGGNRFHPLGLGDDSADMEGAWDEWREGLWPALLAATNSPQHGKQQLSEAANTGAGAVPVEVELPDLPDFEWRVVETTASVPATRGRADSSVLQHIETMSRHFYASVPAVVTAKRELRQKVTDEESTSHIEFQFDASAPVYETADNLYILGENDASIVKVAASALNFSLDHCFLLEAVKPEANPSPIFPTPCSVRDMLTKYIDLAGKVSKDWLGTMTHFATDSTEKQRMTRLVSKAGKQEFTEWALKQQRSVLEVLLEFPSIKIPLEAFVHVMPRLQPRAYTIASSSLVQPTKPAAVISLVNEVKPGPDRSRRLHGICSSYISRLHVGDTVQVYVRPSTFRMPTDPSVPVILVGPGTGIAPMHAFLQERTALQNAGAKLGPALLFFGCRNREQDFIYREEVHEWARTGVITGLHLAFSREQERKVYVQHLIAEQGATLADLLVKQDARVYVCGATTMGHDVHVAFETLLHTYAAMTEDQAKSFVKQMIEKHKYVQELWG